MLRITTLGLLGLGLILTLSLGCEPANSQEVTTNQPIAIAIHGGAGALARDRSTPERDAAFEAQLNAALDAGYRVLDAGGTSLDAITAAIVMMEDAEEFNAGKGAVLTSEGTAELDASIMDGETRNAGAIAGVKRVRNPITLARIVMEDSPHVMMAGEGAEVFGEAQNVVMVANDYFITERRQDQLERMQSETSDAGDSEDMSLHPMYSEPIEQKYGTVGAVALDRAGNLAAGTSTGGMANKRFGRVGDAPIIGAGTYADNATAAVSATGHGEFFIRGAVAHDIAAMMAYGGASLNEAAYHVIMEKLPELGGTGGVIAMDAAGNIAMPFNTDGMYRGMVDTAGNRYVRIYKDADYE